MKYQIFWAYQWKNSGRKSVCGNVQWWIFLRTCSAIWAYCWPKRHNKCNLWSSVMPQTPVQ